DDAVVVSVQITVANARQPIGLLVGLGATPTSEEGTQRAETRVLPSGRKSTVTHSRAPREIPSAWRWQCCDAARCRSRWWRTWREGSPARRDTLADPHGGTTRRSAQAGDAAGR